MDNQIFRCVSVQLPVGKGSRTSSPKRPAIMVPSKGWVSAFSQTQEQQAGLYLRPDDLSPSEAVDVRSSSRIQESFHSFFGQQPQSVKLAVPPSDQRPMTERPRTEHRPRTHQNYSSLSVPALHLISSSTHLATSPLQSPFTPRSFSTASSPRQQLESRPSTHVRTRSVAPHQRLLPFEQQKRPSTTGFSPRVSESQRRWVRNDAARQTSKFERPTRSEIQEVLRNVDAGMAEAEARLQADPEGHVDEDEGPQGEPVTTHVRGSAERSMSVKLEMENLNLQKQIEALKKA